ncbi:MAG: polyphosphate kinase 2 family protein [Eubacteriales bacterium]
MQAVKVDGKKQIKLSDLSTNAPGKHRDKSKNKDAVKANIKKLKALQAKLYAQNEYSLLLVFQAMDAAGKDGMIRSVTSGLNPQGTQVYSFKQPSTEELDHDYLWRTHKAAPERGRVGIFNRSYYEDVLVVRVHNIIKNRQIPDELIDEHIWENRFSDIKAFESYMARNGQKTLKFFLNVSKEEQKQRILSRIDDPAKNWKFSAADIKERKYWDKYQQVYEDAINNTGSEEAPWFVIPADDKWYARHMVSNIIVETLEHLDLQYPELSEEEKSRLSMYREALMKE